MLPYRHIMFIDTEASAKPVNWNSSDKVDWPYIVQAAWAVYNTQGQLLTEQSVIVEAKDYHIHTDALQIHGISEQRANEEGVSRKEALRMFAKDLKRYNPLIVGHFIDLDLRMIQMGFQRAGMKNILPNYKTFCTMHATSDYMHLPQRHYPQLSEIYQMLFKRKLMGAHDALVDVHATAEVFFELIRRGEVNEQVINNQKRIKKGENRKPAGCGLVLMFVLLFMLLEIWIL